MENVTYFTPPAIGYYGKRSIFHAVDHLNIIRNDKTAQQEQQPCRFPQAGSVFQQKPKFLSMENVAYFTPPATGYYGKHSIFHTTSDRLLWKT